MKRCDSHHNTLGYSGTMGNATLVRNNAIYDNATGIATDSFFAGGHPGFPQDSAIFERNRIYDNNFNPFAEGSDVDPTIPVPVGTGILIAGGNSNQVRDNRIYDNWRRGTMLVAVPDALSDGSGSYGTSTSFDNRHYENKMGIAPGGKSKPNGVDFWWDEFAGNAGNCWYENEGGADGISSDPSPIPSDCAASVGTLNASKELQLADCAQWSHDTNSTPLGTCDWFETPPQPGTAAARRWRKAERTRMRAYANSRRAALTCELLGGEGGSLICDPFADRVGG